MNIGLLIASMVFVLTALLGFLVFYYANFFSRRQSIRERIRKEAATGGSEVFSRERKKRSLLLRAAGWFGETVRPKLVKEEYLSKTRERLLRAGYYSEKDPVVFFGAKVFLALFFSLLCMIVFSVLQGLPIRFFLTLLLVFLAAGFYLPDAYLYQRTRHRKRKIFEGFPDALDLIVICVEAGMGIDAAVRRVGEEVALKCKVLSDELTILSLELQVGKPRAEALRNLAMRTGLDEVASLASLLLQTDKFGTRVAQALRVHSESMRTERYLRAEELAGKLPVKLVFPLIFFTFPALFVVIVGPAIIRVFRDLLS